MMAMFDALAFAVSCLTLAVMLVVWWRTEANRHKDNVNRRIEVAVSSLDELRPLAVRYWHEHARATGQNGDEYLMLERDLPVRIKNIRCDINELSKMDGAPQKELRRMLDTSFHALECAVTDGSFQERGPDTLGLTKRVASINAAVEKVRKQLVAMI